MYISKVSIVLFICVCFVACKQTGDASAVTDSKTAEVANSAPIDKAAFFQAALEGNSASVQKAITAGINVNMVEEGNRTAIMLAAFNGHVEVLKLLIKHGADVNVVDVNNRTALMFAASGPYNEAVAVLLAAGADANIVDNGEHWTALMFAAAEGQSEVVMTLIENGADLSLEDIDGESAYDFALAQGHNELAEYLLKSK